MSSRQARYGTFAQRGAARRIAKFITARRRPTVRPRRGVRGATSTVVHSYTRTCSSGTTQGDNDTIGINTQSATGLTMNGANYGVYDIELSFSLSGGVQVLIGGANADTYGMPNATDFSNLYEQYRIDWIDCMITFTNNNSSINQPTTGLPRIFFVEDHDDTAAVNMTGILQYDNLQQWQLGANQGSNTKTIRIHPTALQSVYLSAVATGYEAGNKARFISTAYAGVPHYGVKMMVDPIYYSAGSVAVGNLAMAFKYHLTFRSVK